VNVRPLTDDDRPWLRATLRDGWGDEMMVGAGRLFFPAEHDGFVAGDREGVVTYRIDGGACEITLIESFDPGRGIGMALLDAVVAAARAAGAERVWLVTTNDNLHARGWYERRGFRVTAVREGAIDEARRRWKPSIPLRNERTGVPIRDEIELELPVGETATEPGSS
jgi:ribosomal protein S18 acetylase RimI-like enzyme